MNKMTKVFEMAGFFVLAITVAGMLAHIAPALTA